MPKIAQEESASSWWWKIITSFKLLVFCYSYMFCLVLVKNEYKRFVNPERFIFCKYSIKDKNYLELNHLTLKQTKKQKN